MDQLTMKSTNLSQVNIDKIAALFPGVMTEVKDAHGTVKRAVDFDLLKQELSEVIVEGDNERYQLTWPGKKEAILSANTPIEKTLRPVKADSSEWDNTQNMYIEGDNLEVLKLLLGSYLNKVACIYIDPPYNTGKDFIYKDDFKQSAWLSMMYARLKISRNLLAEDGCILLHIDEHEVANLRKLLDEIYGANHMIGEIVWDKGNPKGDATSVAYQHEMILSYAKNREAFAKNNPLIRNKKNALKILNKAKELFAQMGESKFPEDISSCIKKYKLPRTSVETFKVTTTLETLNQEFANWIKKQDFSGGEAAYSNIDMSGDVYQTVSMAWPNKKKAPDEYFIPLIHPLTGKPCPVPDRGWRNPVKKMNELLERGLIIFGNNETTQPRRKYLLKENMTENVPSVLYFAGSDDSLFKDMKLHFDNPKPYKFSKQLLQYFVSDSAALVLDFFSGSATTAHAVLQLNAEDGGKRKFIMVQLPEQLDEQSDAYKTGYTNICEIGKERIRRASKQIKEDTGARIDYGFRVYRVDST